MKKRILVPVDNTPVTQDVIKLADFWGQKLDAKLLFLHARNAEIQKLVDRGELINPKEGFEQHLENTPCESENEIVYRSGNPYQTILDAEQEFVPEMIVMAAHTHTRTPCSAVSSSAAIPIMFYMKDRRRCSYTNSPRKV